MEKSISRKILVIGLLFLFLGASATLGVSANRAWADNFDSYTEGQKLDGTPDDGGWIGWANNPGAYGTVTSDNFRSGPYSVDINGASDLVHYYNTTSGVWVYTAWLFIPAGQSGGTYGGTYFIMCNAYTDGQQSTTKWSVQIHFDNVNDVVESENDISEWPTLPLIYDQWVQLRVNIDLDTDWFQFYYNDQLLVEKAWTKGVMNDDLGDLAFDAVDLFADGSTTVYYDDMSFLPPGDALVCDAGDPYFGETGEDIQFTGFASGGTEPYTWAWTFGDGGTAAIQNPTHTYTAPGVYNVTLAVTDAATTTVTDTTTATITEAVEEPVLEIGTITGGFGVKAVIKNTGTGAATNVTWSIELTWGAFIGKLSENSIASIAAGAESPIKSKLIFGIGKTTILITATCDEGATAEQSAAGFVLGPFVLGVK
jgi:hypothetical protein